MVIAYNCLLVNDSELVSKNDILQIAQESKVWHNGMLFDIVSMRSFSKITACWYSLNAGSIEHGSGSSLASKQH